MTDYGTELMSRLKHHNHVSSILDGRLAFELATPLRQDGNIGKECACDRSHIGEWECYCGIAKAFVAFGVL